MTSIQEVERTKIKFMKVNQIQKMELRTLPTLLAAPPTVPATVPAAFFTSLTAVPTAFSAPGTHS